MRLDDCLCIRCGEAGWFFHPTGYDPRDGQVTGYNTPCNYCDGSGTIEIEDELIELEDLDEYCGVPS
jgi:hypothetical protein